MDLKQVEKTALSILEPCFPGAVISNLKVESGALAGDNFTCRIYAVQVTLSEKHESTTSVSTAETARESSKVIEHFVIKCFPDNPVRCEFIVKTSIFKKEILVYEELLPELVKLQENRLNENGQKSTTISPFPKYIVGSYEDFDPANSADTFCRSMDHNHVIMKDIRFAENYRTTSRKLKGLDYNHCKVAIGELAKLHALSLVYMKTHLPGKLLHEKFSCLEETLITINTEALRSKILENCAIVGINVLEKEISTDSTYFKKINLFKGKILQIMAHFLAGDANRLTFSQMLDIAPNLDKLHAQNKELKLKSEWHIFCHGDFWASNILFKYSEDLPADPVAAKFVDFQLARQNCLTTDLIFLFYLSTTADFRSKNINQLVKFYFESFLEICKIYDVTPWENFTLENLLKRMSKAKIWGTALSLLALPIIYSGVDDNRESNSNHGPKNPVFEGVGLGNSDMTKILAIRLLEIAKEVVDEGII